MTISLSHEPCDNDYPRQIDKRNLKILGCFSLDADGKYLADRSRLRYLAGGLFDPIKDKQVKYDLNKGLSKRVCKPSENVVSAGEGSTEYVADICLILKEILLNPGKYIKPDSTQPLNTDLVCFRGLLTTLMTTPYERNQGWEIHGARWKNTLYLSQVKTNEQKKSDANMTDRQRTMCAWGYKFEQYMSVPTPHTAVDSNEAVNENEEFNCIFQSDINDINILYGAEMDTYHSKDILEPNATLIPEYFIELKTCRKIESWKHERTYRQYKLMKWWAQAFLVGTKKIYVGWRDDDGIVESLSPLLVDEIPRDALNWRTNVCLNYLEALLSTLIKTIDTEDLEVLHIIKWTPSTGLEITTKSIKIEDHFLPLWYREIFI